MAGRQSKDFKVFFITMKLIQYVLGVWLVALFCSACSAQPEPPPFNYEKAKALTPERRAQMDVAFFNDLVYKSSNTLSQRDSQPRGERIHALAEEGFELAYLAEQIFNFHFMGVKRPRVNQKWWARAQQLAAAGDASASCFIWAVEPDVLDDHPEVPSATRLAALERAAMQGHPQCMGSWGNWHYSQDPADPAQRAAWNLKGAEKSCLQCQSSMAFLYWKGNGVPKDLSKAWCWANEAMMQKTDALQVFSDAEDIARAIWNRNDPETYPNQKERPRLTLYQPNTHCQVVQQRDVLFEPEPLQRILNAHDDAMLAILKERKNSP